jgi:hypothetical protein
MGGGIGKALAEKPRAAEFVCSTARNPNVEFGFR